MDEKTATKKPAISGLRVSACLLTAMRDHTAREGKWRHQLSTEIIEMFIIRYPLSLH